jgi:hypothetical protein
VLLKKGGKAIVPKPRADQPIEAMAQKGNRTNCAAGVSARPPLVAFNMRFDISYGNNWSLRQIPGRARHEMDQVYPSKKKAK